jgi:hypothetical protein
MLIHPTSLTGLKISIQLLLLTLSAITNLDSSPSTYLLYARTKDKRQKQQSQKAKEKRLVEERLQQELRD